jgi:5S rRNA maturation endonuclease (ribonuclease M5)
MITSRPSNDILHTDVILNKISEYDIFKYYCPNFMELNRKFCSDLRKDNKPSVSVVNYNGNLLYKDFGHPNHTFNCFGYVQKKFNLNFTNSLIRISNDFGLGLASSNGIVQSKTPILYNKVIENKKVTIIKKKRRKWKMKDAKFWTKYGINREILSIFAVEPIDYYWINENRFSCKTITYTFRFDNKFKIYAPYEQDLKWFSNTSKEIIQGYDQLPEKGRRLFITSSLKDIMCLYAMELCGIAFQSEMQMPSRSQMQMLQTRFDRIIIFYDNDTPGQTMANKICQTYQLENVFIPSNWNAKDISDAVVVHGFEKVKQFIYEKIQTKEKRQNTE